MKMRLYPLFFLFLSINSFAQKANKASQLLNSVAEKMAAYENMYIKFNYELVNTEVDIQQESNGFVYTAGDKYHLNFMDNLFIYDGTNTYVIVPEDEEVNIIDGSSDEEMLNPSKLLFFYKEGFNYEWQEQKNVNGKQIQYIKLLPIDSAAEAVHFMIGIDTKSNLIYTIAETGMNSTTTTFTIEEFKANQTVAASLFVFDEEKYKTEQYTINR